ncbi:MAG: hypothetical protein Ta2A_19620 [Treponemataceae bacterium]|nr:MAG: hypothetical protein Ta2A_19620 [Treponemataceae bacterium]
MQSIYSSVKKGDVIFANRGLYKHYGIYNNAQSVIHFSPDSGAEISAENAYIRETSLVEFLNGCLLEVDCTIHPHFLPDEVVSRALCFTGKLRGDYDLVFNNCEHFARWCATNEMESKQVESAVYTTIKVMTGLLGMGARTLHKALQKSKEVQNA